MTPYVARLRPYRWLIALIVTIITLRAALLPVTPPGFYVDEAATGAHVVAMIHHGTDAHGQAWPLFSASLGGGYTTPVYLYLLTAWAAIFGPSEVSLRSFSLVVTVLTCVFLGLALRRLLGSTRDGLIACIVGLLLPWGWIQGSLAWDPALVPLFVALSVWMFAIMFTTNNRRQTLVAAIILPLSIISLAYVYPPCRVSAPLLMIAFYALLLWRQKIRWRHAVLVAIGSALLVIPLAHFMIQPDALARSQALSVFHGHSLIAGIGIFVANFLSLLNPLFLFVTGDANLRHATGLQGMLGLAALPPLGALIWMAVRQRLSWRRSIAPYRRLIMTVCLAIVGIVLSYLGSALTAEGQPHSLRATAAWPFYVVMITIGWTMVLRAPQTIVRVTILFVTCTTLLYIADLAFLYPRRAADWFDVSQRHAIMHTTPLDYPELALDYYRWR